MEVRAIWEVVKENKLNNRADIAKSLEIRPNTVGEIIEKLVTKKILKEVGTQKKGKGKPPILLEVDKDYYRIIGVQLTPEDGSVVIGNLKEEILEIQNIPSLSPRSLRASIKEIVKRFSPERIPLICVASVGMLDTTTHKIIKAINLPEYSGIEIDKVLGENKEKIKLIRANNAMAFAELKIGEAKGSKNFIFIHIGKGIGCALYTNEKFVEGYNGLAGEIGHISFDPNGPGCRCGKRGCVEAVSSEGGIIKELLRQIKEGVGCKLKTQKFTIEDIGKLEENDNLIMNVLENAGRYAGKVIAEVVNLFAPETVVLGGKVVWNSTIFTNSLKREIKKNMIEPLRDVLKIKVSTVKKAPAGIGAMLYGVNEFIKRIDIKGGK